MRGCLTFLSHALLVLLCSHACLAKVMVFGGGELDEDNAAIWNKIVDLAGGRGVARIGVITAGNGAPVTAGEKYTALFTTFGVAEAYWVPVRETDPAQAYNPLVVAEVNTMTGFFYSGGNQPRVLNTLLTPSREDTPVMAAIRRRYEEGAVVAGSSGGALVQTGTITVVAGWSYQALKYGPHQVGENVGRRDLVYDPQGGLGFINSHVIDAHFSERGREGRLIRLLADTKSRARGTSSGFGVDENTVLVVNDVDGRNPIAEVVGYHGVVFVDVSDADVDASGPNWQLRRANLHYLTSGDVISLSDQRVSFSPEKRSLLGRESRQNALTSDDVFFGAAKGARSEFRKVAESLFDSAVDRTTYGRSVQSTPAYYVVMTQLSGSKAVTTVDGKISYTNLRVDIRTL